LQLAARILGGGVIHGGKNVAKLRDGLFTPSRFFNIGLEKGLSEPGSALVRACLTRTSGDLQAEAHAA
jgi:hypothetical protein